MQNPPVHSPIEGIVTKVDPKLGLIAIRDKEGFSVEILHTQTQSVQKWPTVRPRQALPI